MRQISQQFVTNDHYASGRPRYVRYFKEESMETPHRENGPALIQYYDMEGSPLLNESYFVDGISHRTDGPADIMYYPNGNIIEEVYLVDGECHRLGEPASTKYDENGNITYKAYYQNGKLIEG